MKFKTAAIGAFVLLALAGLLVPVVRGFFRDHRSYLAKDAVFCISGEVSRLYLKNPTPSPLDIERSILVLHTGSVTAVFVDKNGKPVDVYGTAFQVLRELNGNQQIVTATSAGPDCRFGTADDIISVRTDEIPPLEKP